MFVALVGAAAAIVPSAAHAAKVSVVGDTVVYAAAAREVNTVEVFVEDVRAPGVAVGDIGLLDPGGIQAGPGCRAGSGPSLVRCSAVGVRGIELRLGDENDEAVVGIDQKGRSAPKLPVRVFGGAGDDGLYRDIGPAGSITLAGGAGADTLVAAAQSATTLLGGSGGDELTVAAGSADEVSLFVSAGPGDDVVTAAGGRPVIDLGTGDDFTGLAAAAGPVQLQCGGGFDSTRFEGTADGTTFASDCERRSAPSPAGRPATERERDGVAAVTVVPPRRTDARARLFAARVSKKDRRWAVGCGVVGERRFARLMVRRPASGSIVAYRAVGLIRNAAATAAGQPKSARAFFDELVPRCFQTAVSQRSAPTITDDSIAGIELGDRVDQVLRILGRPSRTVRRETGTGYFFGPKRDRSVYVTRKRRVQYVETKSTRDRDAFGLGPGAIRDSGAVPGDCRRGGNRAFCLFFPFSENDPAGTSEKADIARTYFLTPGENRILTVSLSRDDMLGP